MTSAPGDVADWPAPATPLDPATRDVVGSVVTVVGGATAPLEPSAPVEPSGGTPESVGGASDVVVTAVGARAAPRGDPLSCEALADWPDPGAEPTRRAGVAWAALAEGGGVANWPEPRTSLLLPGAPPPLPFCLPTTVELAASRRLPSRCPEPLSTGGDELGAGAAVVGVTAVGAFAPDCDVPALGATVVDVVVLVDVSVDVLVDVLVDATDGALAPMGVGCGTPSPNDANGESADETVSGVSAGLDA